MIAAERDHGVADVDLDPGIRRTVRWLQAEGFRTTDSGDGVTKIAAGWDPEQVCDYPHVVCMVSPLHLATEANHLARLVNGLGVDVVPNGRRGTGQAEVRASLDPVDGSAVLVLVGVGDAELFPEGT
jgi:hypothetical protein